MGGSHRGVLETSDDYTFVAAAERYLDRQAEAVADAEAHGAKVYGDYWEMLDEVDDLDLMMISTPHSWHAPYAIAALQRGWHVFVEKPVTVTVQEALALLDAQRQADRLVGVHFQYTSTGATRQLKELLAAGTLGKLKEVVAVMKWFREQSYYERNEWAGRRYVEGLPCWDGVLMNQAIHLVNSALQFSTRRPEFGLPTRVQAEAYRLHDIETEDLACLRCEMDEAVLSIYATTCAAQDYPVELHIVGEDGEAWWNVNDVKVKLKDGGELILNDEPYGDDTHRNIAACVRGLERNVYAPAHEAAKATITVNAAYVSAGRIPRIPRDDGTDIAELVNAAAAKRLMFSEVADAPKWTKPGDVVDVADFTSFDGLEDDEGA
jgi:predicted dehydrogenase